MKKYMVEVFTSFTDEDGREDFHEVYECESYTNAKNWTGNCIRLDDVNTLTKTKTGKEKRKQLARGRYITIEKMRHWKSLSVYVWKNGTENIVEKWEL